MSAPEFGALKQSDPAYYTGRWPYFAVAASMVRTVKPQRVLEVGPYRRPLCEGSDVLDINPKISSAVTWDARRAPWPFAEQSYDLVVALQVWEHLGPSQAAAFREVVRVSRYALLSFPLGWKMKNTGDCHHGITRAQISEWTLGLEPAQAIPVSKPDARYTRLVCLYDLKP